MKMLKIAFCMPCRAELDWKNENPMKLCGVSLLLGPEIMRLTEQTRAQAEISPRYKKVFANIAEELDWW